MGCSAPMLPSENPTTSYWQDPPHPWLSTFCSDGFPAQVDTVIIGSGITGALIASELLARDHGSSKKSLLMLEARAISSGATGRNGGHIKPDCYRGFLDYSELHGPQIAKEQCEFERANRESLTEFIKAEGLQERVDLVELRSCDAFMAAESWERAKASYESFKEYGGNIDSIEIYDAETAHKKFRLSGCCGAITYPACSLWPYKLVTAILERSIRKGLIVHTYTPVTKVSASVGSGRWAISTSKGVVLCDQVFHATNGYASSLNPEISKHVVPLKGTVVAIKPSPEFVAQPLDHTYALHWDKDFDYLIQRPNDGMPLIYGGGDLHHPGGLTGHVGDSNDSTLTPEVVNALESIPSKFFTKWGDQILSRQTWTGIMALTSDELPFIGELPEKPGQYISAGYHGHGMARAFLTVRALCQSIYGEPVDPRCPSVYFDIKSRLSKPSPWAQFI